MVNMVNTISPKYIEPEFNVYVQQFEIDCNCKVNVPIKFNMLYDLGESTLGVCTIFHGMNKEIFINVKSWQYLSIQEREQLIYHELGHCALDRPHDETILENGMPKSFMYPMMFPYSKTLRSYYLNELFNNY